MVPSCVTAPTRSPRPPEWKVTSFMLSPRSMHLLTNVTKGRGSRHDCRSLHRPQLHQLLAVAHPNVVERPLEDGHNACAHFSGSKTGVGPNHADHRYVDIRKDINWRAQKNYRAD